VANPAEEPEATMAAIRRLLDEHDTTDMDRPLPERVASVIAEADGWCALATRKEHDLHRTLGKECDRCSIYLDGSRA
jgi:hypothetical protein